MGLKNCKPCKSKKKSNFTGGSILDRVISQSSNEDQCLLYKLANYKKGGELIEAYNLGGQIEVEKPSILFEDLSKKLTDAAILRLFR